MFLNYRLPSQYTGELFGVCYLYNQTGRSLTASGPDQLDSQIDEGFGDVDELEESSSVTTYTVDQDEHSITVAPPTDPDSDEDEVIMNFLLQIDYVMLIQHTHLFTLQDEAVEDVDDEAIDHRGIPGWEKVDRLAKALLSLKGLCVTNTQAEELKTLYSELLDYDRRPITFQPRQIKRTRGRFARSKKGYAGVDAMKR